MYFALGPDTRADLRAGILTHNAVLDGVNGQTDKLLESFTVDQHDCQLYTK